MEERVVDTYGPFFRGAKPLGAPRVQHRPVEHGIACWMSGRRHGQRRRRFEVGGLHEVAQTRTAGPQVQIADEQQQIGLARQRGQRLGQRFHGNILGGRQPRSWKVRGRHRGVEFANLRLGREQPRLVKAEVWDRVTVGEPHSRCIGRRNARQQGRSHPRGGVRRWRVDPLDEGDAGVAGDLLGRGLAGLPRPTGRTSFVEEDDIGLEVGELRGDERAPALPLPREAPDVPHRDAQSPPRAICGALCRACNRHLCQPVKFGPDALAAPE